MATKGFNILTKYQHLRKKQVKYKSESESENKSES